MPVDTTSVWATYTLAAEYADNNGTDDYCPYDGQIVVTLQGYPDVTDVNSEKYKTAHVWRLKKDGPDTTVNGLTRQHFVLEEVKAGTEVAGTNEHNTFTGTQTFESWIELLGGMTMGYKLAKKKDEAGNPIIKTDSITGKPLYIDGEGNERVLTDDMERIWLDGRGKGHMVISALKVLGTLEVSEIDVNHIKHSGGLFVNSRANIIVDSVEQLSGDRTKLTFVGQANGQTLFNLFEVGDLALSMTFNVLKEGASTPSEGKVVRWYWREVVAVDDTSITLAPQDASLPEMATPRKGDTVVQVGHVDAPEGAADDKKAHVASRQGLQVMGFSDTNGPFIAEYSGIKAPSASISFDEPSQAIVYLSPKYHKLQGDEINFKFGQNYISLADKITTMAGDIITNAKKITTHANVLDLYTDESLNIRSRAIEAKVETTTFETEVANIRAGNVRLVTIPASGTEPEKVVLQALNRDGTAMGNLGGALVFGTDGSVQGVMSLTSGSVNYDDGFTLKAKNINFEGDGINVNTPVFRVNTEKNPDGTWKKSPTALFEGGKIKAEYIEVSQLAADIISAINGAQGLTINASKIEFVNDNESTELINGNFVVHTDGSVELNNLTVGGTSVFGQGTVFKGRLQAATGEFSGDISGSNGTFNGSVVIKEGTAERVKIDGKNISDGDISGNTRVMHVGPNGLLALLGSDNYLLAKTDGIEMRWGNDGIKLGSGGMKRYDSETRGWIDMFSRPKAITINSSTTLDNNVGIVVCGGAGFEITMPASPANGDQIMIKATVQGSSVLIKPNTRQELSHTDEGNGKRLHNTDCCWLTYMNGTWYWNYAEV